MVSKDAAMPKVPGRRRSLASEREVGPPERESGAREGGRCLPVPTHARKDVAEKFGSARGLDQGFGV